MVMKNGRLYDAATMNEIGNHPRRQFPFYREHPKTSDAFVWRGPDIGFGMTVCGCFVEMPR